MTDRSNYNFLRAYLESDGPFISDQRNKVPAPPTEKSVVSDNLITLPNPNDTKLSNSDIRECMNRRRSYRLYQEKSITLEDLSFLLWSTQGVKGCVDDKHHDTLKAMRRTVPSAGSRHPFETYLAVHCVDGIDCGIYRYVGTKHSLELIRKEENLRFLLAKYTFGQRYCGAGALFFCWSIIPYRTEWRYGTKVPVKVIPLDGGHIGQNLHLACEALNLGTVMIGAYHQEKMDELFGLDGVDEFAFYMAPVGHPK